jgi:ubiquinone/menaquinone biosynthesis C-methylase UbiE
VRLWDPIGSERKRLVSRASGLVLDVGAGPGPNLPLFPPEARVVAAEPDPHMLRRLRQAARRRPQTHVVQARAEALPFRDGTFDAVVCTLVLCSVGDLHASVRELFRVLRPGGSLFFYEHVRAASRFWARVQDLFTPLWRRLAAGCHPNRDTVAALRQAGFRVEEVRACAVGPYPTRPHVHGAASKPRAVSGT